MTNRGEGTSLSALVEEFIAVGRRKWDNILESKVPHAGKKKLKYYRKVKPNF